MTRRLLVNRIPIHPFLRRADKVFVDDDIRYADSSLHAKGRLKRYLISAEHI